MNLVEKILQEGVTIPRNVFNFMKKKYNISKLLPAGTRGSYGAAYLTNDNKILKYTTDSGEALFFNSIKNKNFKHIAKVYSVTEFGTTLNQFFILREYIPKLLSAKERKYFDLALNLSDEKKYTSNKKPPKEFIDKSTNLPRGTDKVLLTFMLEQVLEILEEFYSFNLNHSSRYAIDIHSENVGYRNGVIVVFDLSTKADEQLDFHIPQEKVKVA